MQVFGIIQAIDNSASATDVAIPASAAKAGDKVIQVLTIAASASVSLGADVVADFAPLIPDDGTLLQRHNTNLTGAICLLVLSRE